MTNSLNIFLDETGKKNNELSLIGAISIPIEFYNSINIQNLNTELKNNQFKLHFTQYDRSHYDIYIKVFKLMLQSSGIIKMNGIIFKKSQFRSHPLLKSKVDDMIYQKVPERVIYGLLRNYSNLDPINANIYIEDSEEYRARNLGKNIKEQINTHALYRFDNFKIIKSKLVSKNQQIGIEFTDILIGMLRFIICYQDTIANLDEISKTALSKVLLINDLLPLLEIAFAETSIFELSYQDHLCKIPLNSYLGLFKSMIISLKESHPNYFKNNKYKKITRNKD